MPGQVLIVDDDYDIRTTLETVLEEEGYRVRTADDGQKALEILRARAEPCLVLLDLMMPVMDGWTFLRHIREEPHLCALPIVVLTAVDEAQFPAGLPPGRCLRKPMDLDRVLEIVGHLCQRPPSPPGVSV